MFRFPNSSVTRFHVNPVNRFQSRFPDKYTGHANAESVRSLVEEEEEEEEEEDMVEVEVEVVEEEDTENRGEYS